MKRTFIFLSFTAATLCAPAQTRTSLYEEFTSENFGIWYPTNPVLNTLLSNSSALVIPIKWEVPIPTAPANASSLYQTDKAEINWRCRSSSGSTVLAGPSATAYGYPSQNTATSVATNGINVGLTGRLDGQHQWVFGAASDDPSAVNNAVIASAQTQTTNFKVSMTPSWSPTFTNCEVSINVTSITSFTSLGALMFRLCLVERAIHFATAPGINGEKDFYDAVRQSYPTTIVNGSVTAMGTPLSNTWAPGQIQSFTVSCNIPAYIHDLSEMAFVGFVQDDGDRKVYQAVRTLQPSIPNDIKASALNIPLSCNGSFTPAIITQNLGPVSVTALTITPYIDGVVQPVFNYAGNIASNTSVSIALPGYTAAYGNHTFSASITGVSGGDINNVNNSIKGVFGISNTITAGVAEPFATFPPTDWYVLNYDFAPATWGLGQAGGFGSSSTSAKYDFYNILGMGDYDDLYLPPLNLTGVSNVVLSFDVAYAQYTNQNDRLDVMTSTDCGATWTNVFTKQGTVLSTAPSYSAGPFVPSATQWRNESISLPALANQPSVLLKFVATSDFGNNLYVDNVNLGDPPVTTTTSINQINSSITSCQVFPNPTSDLTTLSVNLSANATVGFTVINSIGQLVYATKNNNFSTGINNIALNTGDWAPGIYFINVSTTKGSVNTKLNVTK